MRRERPPAPWGSFPLAELCVVVAIGLGIAGLVTRGHQGAVMLLCALALGSLAGLEVSIREHFAGFKSHSTLLAGAAAVIVVVLLVVIANPPKGIAIAIAVVVFLIALRLLRVAFRRRSGGRSFR